MPRHRKDYSGERRTAFIGFQVTPTERVKLEEGAARKAVTLSEHARELCLRRSGHAEIRVSSVARDADKKALVDQLIAIGNNLNQLTRRAHLDQATPQAADLQATTDRVKWAIGWLLSK